MTLGRIIIISGPSGSGKTTLYKRLLERSKDLVKSISVTTRKRRPGERNGRDYFFVTKEAFLKRKRQGAFLEYQKVFDNYYGTPYQNVRKLLQKGKNVLLCIDVKGARVVKRKFKDAVKIFIKTPSMSVLRKRLEKRGSEDKKTISLRFETAKRELKEAKRYDYVIVNNNLDVSCERLSAIVNSILKGSPR